MGHPTQGWPCSTGWVDRQPTQSRSSGRRSVEEGGRRKGAGGRSGFPGGLYRVPLCAPSPQFRGRPRGWECLPARPCPPKEVTWAGARGRRWPPLRAVPGLRGGRCPGGPRRPGAWRAATAGSDPVGPRRQCVQCGWESRWRPSGQPVQGALKRHHPQLPAGDKMGVRGRGEEP